MAVSRETLYAEVWAEPMTTVAARYEVSSSFLARVCERLVVPRPPRGYWAKLKFQKDVVDRPALPDARPGDELEWSREGEARTSRPRELPKAPANTVEPSVRPRGPRPTRHPAVVGALEHLGSGRVTRNGYLKPLKQNVVDVFVTKGTLTRALDLASRLYLALEERGHRVVLAPRDAHLYRTSLDPSGRDGASGIWDGESWSPRRPTVVYIGTVAIGLTLYEWSEEVEVRYQNGEYHRVTTKSVVPGRRTLPDPLTWTTQRHLPSGHLGLRAYSADHRSTWKMEWREEKERELKGMLDAIVRELERAAVVVARLIEEGEQRAQEERRRWEAADRERRRQEEERRRVQAHKDSREQLLAIVDGWVLASNIESFFQNALRGVDGLEAEAKEILVSRLERARRMFGGTDALRHFEHWKSPEER